MFFVQCSSRRISCLSQSVMFPGHTHPSVRCKCEKGSLVLEKLSAEEWKKIEHRLLPELRRSTPALKTGPRVKQQRDCMEERMGRRSGTSRSSSETSTDSPSRSVENKSRERCFARSPDEGTSFPSGSWWLVDGPSGPFSVWLGKCKD